VETIQWANIFYRRFKKYFMGKSAAYLKQILFAAANISYIYGEKSCLYPTPNL